MKFVLRTFLAALFLVATASLAMAACTVPGNGGGTVDLPPIGCEYLSPDEVHMIINGLPPGTTIRLSPIHGHFFGVQHAPDGTGGEIENFNSTVSFVLQGTGALAGYNRPMEMVVQCQAQTDQRPPGSVQSFDTEMKGMQGQIVGDPDFDLLRITAGGNFGMPSPGHTTLTQLAAKPGATTAADLWAVDSFFDITYRIDFVGRPGGPLGGMSGSTTGTIRMSTGTHAQAVPSTSVWGQIALSLLVLGTGVVVLQRRVLA